MKLKDILIEKTVAGPRLGSRDAGYHKPGYSARNKFVTGHVADWMDKLGVTAEMLEAGIS